MDVFTAFEAELAAALRASPAPAHTPPDSESGLGTARALAAIIDQLSRAHGGEPLGAADQQRTFALALRQVDADGRPVNTRLNKPDISYVGDAAGTRRRVNIEIETRNLQRHVADVNRDAQAHNVFLRVDPWTGDILGGLERAPGSTSVRPLTAAEARALLGQLPKPQRDPTLAVNPRTQAQFRRATRLRRRRPPGASIRSLPRGARQAEWEALLDRAAREIDGG